MALCKHPPGLSYYFQVCVCVLSPPPPLKPWKPSTQSSLFSRSFQVHHKHRSHSKNKGCVHMSTSSTHSPPFPHLQICHPADIHTQVNTMPDILIWLKCLRREGCHCSFILFLHLLFVFWQSMNKDVTFWTDSQCVVSSSGAELRTNESDRYCFQMLMKFPPHMNQLFGPLVPENV